MSETYAVFCDTCSKDITFIDEEAHRIRVLSEGRQPQIYLSVSAPELNTQLNFCNIAHLREWLDK